MPIVSLVRDVCGSRADVFRLLCDTKLRLQWDCLTQGVSHDGDVLRGRGGLLWLGRGLYGLSMEVEHLSLVAPASALTLMRKGPFWLKGYSCYWRLECKTAQLTRLHLQCAFSSRWPWLSGCFAPLLKRIIARDIMCELQCLQESLENTYSSSTPSVPVMVSLPLVTK